MTPEEKEYTKVFNQSRHTEYLSGAMQVLEWDQETYMPAGAHPARSEQLKTLSGLIHKERTSPKFSKPLSKLIDLKTGVILANGLDARKKSALREWQRAYLIDTALPKKFVEDFTKLSSDSINAWRDAKKNNNFKSFLPYFKKIISASRKKADYLGYQKHPYDALLDLYEPYMTIEKITPIFDRLKVGIIDLLKKIAASPQIDDTPLYGRYPAEKQLEISREILKIIGYDSNHGRLDLSTHPFSNSSHPSDSRITTRIDETYVFSCLSGVMHEMGHSFYAMGLPQEEFGSPLGQAISMGIHESQSRFWETRIGQSRPFIKFLLPLLQKTFPGQLQGVDELSCYRAFNKVAPSFIRVDADEVTYPLHVILRYELEKGLIEGSIKPEEIPEAWNAKMQESLGILPPNDSKGCLQDIHWAMGGLGYFPTYSLGNVFAAMIFKTFEKAHPDWEKQIASGSFAFIKAFLEKNVYRHGKEFTSDALLERITCSEISEKDYLSYLNQKYASLYF